MAIIVLEPSSSSPVFGGLRGGEIGQSAQMLKVRTFLMDSGGVPRPFALARFQRLWNGDDRERIADHAGSVAQFADVFVEGADNGLPTRVLRIDCLRIRVDADGRLDPHEKERVLSLAVRSLRLPSPWRGDAVLEGDHRFARQAARHFRWMPTASQRATMERLALSRR